jgi:hypothetical protein
VRFSGVFFLFAAPGAWPGTRRPEAPNVKLGKRGFALFCSFFRFLIGFFGIWIGALARLSSRSGPTLFSGDFSAPLAFRLRTTLTAKDAKVAKGGLGDGKQQNGTVFTAETQRAQRKTVRSSKGKIVARGLGPAHGVRPAVQAEGPFGAAQGRLRDEGRRGMLGLTLMRTDGLAQN